MTSVFFIVERFKSLTFYKHEITTPDHQLEQFIRPTIRKSYSEGGEGEILLLTLKRDVGLMC